MPQTFGRGPCRFCPMRVSSCGYGEWNHLRMHYRQVYEREPPDWFGVNDLVGRILDWKRMVINCANEASK